MGLEEWVLEEGVLSDRTGLGGRIGMGCGKMEFSVEDDGIWDYF